jgi:hypothetical protein
MKTFLGRPLKPQLLIVTVPSVFSAAAISSLLMPEAAEAAALAEADALADAAALGDAGALAAGTLAATLAAADCDGAAAADVLGATDAAELLHPTRVSATIAAKTPRLGVRLITWPSSSWCVRPRPT